MIFSLETTADRIVGMWPLPGGNTPPTLPHNGTYFPLNLVKQYQNNLK